MQNEIPFLTARCFVFPRPFSRLSVHAVEGLPEGFHYVIDPSQTVELVKTRRLEECLALSELVQGKDGK